MPKQISEIKDKKIKNIVYHDITITAKSKDSDTCYICTATSEGNESKLALSEEKPKHKLLVLQRCL